MRGLFLSRCSSEEIYDQRPEDGGAAGDGVKFFRFFSPPVDLFLQWTKKNAPKRASQKDLPVDREIDETPGVWLDTKNIRAARPDCRLYGHKIECLPMDNQLIETF